MAVQQQVEELIAKYPIVIEQAPITEMLSSMQGQAASLGQAIVGFGLSSIPGVFTLRRLYGPHPADGVSS